MLPLSEACGYVRTSRGLRTVCASIGAKPRVGSLYQQRERAESLD